MSELTVIRVLLVDDQALFREGLRTLLSVWDDILVVGEAANGQEGVTAVAQLQPDVVLMDLRMPLLDGVAATKQITTTYPDSRVIVLTTFDDDDHIFDGLRAGAVGYLLKDVPSVSSNKEIARQLYITEGTVKNHVTHILGKLGVRDRTQAALKANELGLLG